MWRHLAGCLCLLLVLVVTAGVLVPPFFGSPCSVQTLDGCVLICTVCSDGSSVPSSPVTFAARFVGNEFITISAPLCLDEPPPPPQTGIYRFTPAAKRGKEATLKLKQPNADVVSVLKLRFSHPSGGCMSGTMSQRGERIAEQIGMFQICGGKPVNRERLPL